MNKIIMTQDKETADKLIKLGFQFLNKNGSIYTFVNADDKLMFSNDIDQTKIIYKNVLTF